jgi:hypothetical protein
VEEPADDAGGGAGGHSAEMINASNSS